MLSETLLLAILDSLKDPLLFVDTGHITRYMNKAAITHYPSGEDLIGQSLLECHNEASQETMVEILALMITEGLEERQISEEDGKRIFMRAVRDRSGSVLGYYERFEPMVDL